LLKTRKGGLYRKPKSGEEMCVQTYVYLYIIRYTLEFSSNFNGRWDLVFSTTARRALS